MAGRDPERIAESLRRIADGSLKFKISGDRHRTISPEMLVIAADEMDRMREYLLETSGRLHQIASDSRMSMTDGDLHNLAEDMCKMANRREGS